MRRIGFAAVLLGLLGVLTAGLLELGVRVIDPQVLNRDVPDLWAMDPAIGWRHEPNKRVVANTGDRDVEVCTDAVGDRVACDGPAERACARRVLVLGDSYVEALAVPFEQTIWSRIEADTGACASVSGVSGHRLSQYLAAARARLAEPGAKYDLVLLAFYVGNDMTDDAETIPPPQDVQRRPWRLLPSGLSAEALFDWFYPMNAWLESHSHAYVAVRFAIRRLRDPGDAGLYGVSRALRRSLLTQKHLDETTRGVRLVAEAARAHGARVLVLVIPERTQVTDPQGEKILRAMPALEGDLDMDQTSREFVPRLEALAEVDRVIDLLPILRARTDPADWGPNDGHLSPQGHARVFDAIREPVRELMSAD